VAVVLPRYSRVERHDSHGVVIDAVVKRSTSRQVRVILEGCAEVVTVIVVARNNQIRNGQLTKQFDGGCVLIRMPFVHQIARQENQVGPPIEVMQVFDRVAEHSIRIDHTLVQLARGADVDVGELRDEHDVIPVQRLLQILNIAGQHFLLRLGGSIAVGLLLEHLAHGWQQ